MLTSSGLESTSRTLSHACTGINVEILRNSMTDESSDLAFISGSITGRLVHFACEKAMTSSPRHFSIHSAAMCI